MKTGRKISGGRYHASRKQKLYERKGKSYLVVLGDDKRKHVRVRGGNMKTLVLRAKYANILINGKVKKAEITNVEETPQNKFFARENRLMKGAIISTSIGKAKITNRPSQEGCVNAISISS